MAQALQTSRFTGRGLYGLFRSSFWKFRTAPLHFLAVLAICAGGAAAHADEVSKDARLLLYADVKAATTQIEIKRMQPFDVFLVSERDGDNLDVSAAGFTLELPKGVLVVGEEILVSSLITLGTPKAGMYLTFRCLSQARVPLMRFRLVASQPLPVAAMVRLLPEPRTSFRGIVSCDKEKFSTLATADAGLELRLR